MPDPRQRLCDCGRPVYERTEVCRHCLQYMSERPQSRTRTGRSRYVSAEQPMTNNRLAARAEDCRRSLDLTNLRGYREMTARNVFTHAFTSEPDDDDDNYAFLPDNAIDLFPPSVYRRSSRTPSRTSSSRSGSVYSLSSGPTPAGRSSLSSQAQPSDPLARPATSLPLMRDTASRTTNDRGYSPMAAGFARLNHKTSHSVSGGTTRATSRDASLATMDARMFAGPA